MLKKILWQEVTAIKRMPHNIQKLPFSATLRILLPMAVPFCLHSLTYSFHFSPCPHLIPNFPSNILAIALALTYHFFYLKVLYKFIQNFHRHFSIFPICSGDFMHHTAPLKSFLPMYFPYLPPLPPSHNPYLLMLGIWHRYNFTKHNCIYKSYCAFSISISTTL